MHQLYYMITILITLLHPGVITSNCNTCRLYTGFESHVLRHKKKPTPRRTRGFSHVGKALNPRGTRATCNLVCQLRVDLLNYFLFFGLSGSVKDN